jgi:hypothetical protein
VLPVVSSAVFLPVCPSLIAVGSGSTFQLLNGGFRFAIVVEKATVGRGMRREEGEEAGKHALLIKLQA